MCYLKVKYNAKQVCLAYVDSAKHQSWVAWIAESAFM